jgi:hypothetical protein
MNMGSRCLPPVPSTAWLLHQMHCRVRHVTFVQISIAHFAMKRVWRVLVQQGWSGRIDTYGNTVIGWVWNVATAVVTVAATLAHISHKSPCLKHALGPSPQSMSVVAENVRVQLIRPRLAQSCFAITYQPWKIEDCCVARHCESLNCHCVSACVRRPCSILVASKVHSKDARRIQQIRVQAVNTTSETTAVLMASGVHVTSSIIQAVLL